MDGITLGQIVHSKAGRDKDRYFIIVGVVNDEYVLLADGDMRKISSPKKKKLKHLVLHDNYAEDIRSMLNENIAVKDSDLRKSIKSIKLK